MYLLREMANGLTCSCVNCGAVYTAAFNLSFWEPETTIFTCRKHSNVRVIKIPDHTC